MFKRIIIAVLSTFVLSGQGQNPASPSASEVLSRVAEFHGAAGVFAVVGYRIGARALSLLNEKRGSFSLDVTHRTPLEVQWSCIADGIQASTGVSAGKLNLHVVETTRENLETVIRDHRSGKLLSFHLQAAFLSKFLDIPENRQPEAAREVLKLPDDAIFTVQQGNFRP
jgi:formylmethanofuran dehydrogenase subunit E